MNFDGQRWIAREGPDIAGARAGAPATHEKSSVGCAVALATLDVIAGGAFDRTCAHPGKAALVKLVAPKAKSRSWMWSKWHRAVDGRGGWDDARGGRRDVMYRCLEKGLSFKVGQGTVLNLSPAPADRRTRLPAPLRFSTRPSVKPAADRVAITSSRPTSLSSAAALSAQVLRTISPSSAAKASCSSSRGS